MSLIYVPDYESSNCAVIQSTGVIRVYDTVPQINSTINYKDYFINSSYIYNENSQTFGQFANIPIHTHCLLPISRCNIYTYDLSHCVYF